MIHNQYRSPSMFNDPSILYHCDSVEKCACDEEKFCDIQRMGELRNEDLTNDDNFFLKREKEHQEALFVYNFMVSCILEEQQFHHKILEQCEDEFLDALYWEREEEHQQKCVRNLMASGITQIPRMPHFNSRGMHTHGDQSEKLEVQPAALVPNFLKMREVKSRLGLHDRVKHQSTKIDYYNEKTMKLEKLKEKHNVGSFRHSFYLDKITRATQNLGEATEKKKIRVFQQQNKEISDQAKEEIKKKRIDESRTNKDRFVPNWVHAVRYKVTKL